MFFSPARCTILNRSGCMFSDHLIRRARPDFVVAADGCFGENSATKLRWSVCTRLLCLPPLIQCWYRGSCSPMKYASLSIIAHRNCEPRNFPDMKASGLWSCSSTGLLTSVIGICVMIMPQKLSLASPNTHVTSDGS